MTASRTWSSKFFTETPFYQSSILVFLERQWHKIHCMGTPYAATHLLSPTYYLQMIQWFFYGATLAQATTLRDIRCKYEKASGQMNNFTKTNVVFTKGVPVERCQQVTLYLDIREVLLLDKYLGAPTFVGRSKKKLFLFLVDRIKKWQSGFMERLVSWTGKEVLLKQSLPTLGVPFNCIWSYVNPANLR